MYKDYYLRFPDKQTALDAFSQIGLTYDLSSPQVVYAERVAIGTTSTINPQTQEEEIVTLYDEPVAIATYTKAVIDQTPTAAIDEVGVIYNNDAVYETNEETGEVILISPATPREGYHYNYRIIWGQLEEIPLPGIMTSYAAKPRNPIRKFF